MSIFSGVNNPGLVLTQFTSAETEKLIQISSIVDPGYDYILGYDTTDNSYQPFVIGTGLTYTHATHTLSSSGGGGGDSTDLILSTTTGIDLTSSDTIDLYTVPGGKKAVITGIIFRVTSGSDVVETYNFALGSGSTSSGSTLEVTDLLGLLIVEDLFQIHIEGKSVTFPDGDIIQLILND